MIQKINYCVNHPNIVANDICSQCNNPICYNCRLKAFGKIFCGMKCLTTFLIKKFVDGVFLFFSFVLRALIWPFKKLVTIPFRALIELLLFVGLILSFYFIWSLKNNIKAIKSTQKQQSLEISPAETLSVPLPKIFTPTKSGMVFSNTLNIEGQAGNNQIVSLSIDGKLERATIPKNGSFKFNNVRLHRGNNRVEVRAISYEGEVSILQRVELFYATPTLAYLSKNLSRGPLERKECALTFDGGSINNAADEILDILKENRIKCTFFLTGQFIKNFPKTVRRIANEGHEVGNHTWDHPKLTTFEINGKHNTMPGVTKKFVQDELNKTAALYKLITKHDMEGLWRAPYGYYNSEILMWAAEAGFKHIGWTVGRDWENNMDTLDWVADTNSKAYRTSEEIVRKVVNFGKNKKYGANGVIILMHLGTNRKKDFPHKKLPEIIKGLRDRGYSFVKVSELLK